MKIKVGRSYITRGGRKVRVIADDIKGDRPVAVSTAIEDGSEVVYQVSENGLYNPPYSDGLDLVYEHSFWQDVKVDAPILVFCNIEHSWKKRHFAKYENGMVYAWVDGGTSWTVSDCVPWDDAKLAIFDEEERNDATTSDQTSSR